MSHHDLKGACGGVVDCISLKGACTRGHQTFKGGCGEDHHVLKGALLCPQEGAMTGVVTPMSRGID